MLFDLAPAPLWIEDYTDVKVFFDRWRAEGVVDVEAFLRENPDQVAACAQAIRVIQVNQKTLTLYEAQDLEHLKANLDAVFRDDMLDSHLGELVQLYEGGLSFKSYAVNYTLSGRRLDIQLHGTILPGHEEDFSRVLVTTEDVTEREEARRREAEQALYATGLFEHSPVSLWVEDFSRIKELLEELRERGISDLRVFTDVHPEFVRQCMTEIRVIDVNRATLDLFEAPDRQSLLQNQHKIFRHEMQEPFREQLIDLWEGRLLHKREVMNYTLEGSERYLLLQFTVFPGYEDTWSLVQVSLTDITARKKAEAYLEYLGKHDVLTKLHNRAFFVEELNRLERKKVRPIGVLIIDLNHLKETNDILGHEAGDNLLRRIGEVLSKSVSLPNCASRIGGDEFAVLMPGADAKAVKTIMEQIEKVLHVNNQFYSQIPISVAMGAAVCEEGETVEAAVRRADLAMYHEKREYYSMVAGNGQPSDISKAEGN